jgi:hypothetical protein
MKRTTDRVVVKLREVERATRVRFVTSFDVIGARRARTATPPWAGG